MLQVLSVTFPFFALVLIGWAVARRGAMPLEAIGGLNVFVLFYALPCMLYRFAAGTPIVRLLDVGVTVTYLLCAVAMVALSVTIARARIGWNDASFGALATAFPNSGFMGVPLLVALLGPAAAGPAIVCLSIDMVFTSSLCIALSRLGAAGRGGRHAVFGAVKGMAGNPLPWAIVLGCVSSATGVEPPPAVVRVIGMLADAASPVALFTLGAVLARSQVAGAVARPQPGPRAGSGVQQAVLCKLLLHPALTFVVGKLAIVAGLPLDGFSLTVLALAAALPSASNVPMLAERFGADAGRIARIVLLTTAAAFVSFSGAVALLR